MCDRETETERQRHTDRKASRGTESWLPPPSNISDSNPCFIYDADDDDCGDDTAKMMTKAMVMVTTMTLVMRTTMLTIMTTATLTVIIIPTMTMTMLMPTSVHTLEA